MKLLRAISILALAAQAVAVSVGGHKILIDRESNGLQSIVTYDEHSLKVYGERIFIFSGEFHPYRLPVPDLWLDVFQKIKALGFNTVSFYTHWALLEGEEGVYRADGVLAVEPFFDAAKQAGIYLIARPGPYVNAESSGGGFPGWLARVTGQLRTRAPDYLSATDNYMANIGASIAKAQITNGGPIILIQPENEYTSTSGNATGGFPDPVYFAYVKKQLRDAGIVVPLISNDARQVGYFAPGSLTGGSTAGNVDIYGYDSYPLGFDCAHPYTWPAGRLPTTFHSTHEALSPFTFNSINEFQGGSFDPWGGLGFAQCSVLLNMEFERVFYKNNIAAGLALLNIYMIYGGTNWGNNGHPGGYTSYDYGAGITENREIWREKYSELKLEANFVKVSPALLTTSVGNGTFGYYTNSTTIFTTPLFGNSTTNFYVVRHTDYQAQIDASYVLRVKTSKGRMTIPQLDGPLTLTARDSKIHVTDYDLGGTNLLYSSAEIFTWKKFDIKTVLIVYGGVGEYHELAVTSNDPATVVEGSGITTVTDNGSTIVNWQTTTARRVVQIGTLFVYMLDRNSAYKYWVPDFVREDKWQAYSTSAENTESVIVDAGYLIRSVSMSGADLYIDGDLNATVPINVIGAPTTAKNLYFNSKRLEFTEDDITGDWSSTLTYPSPDLDLPDLSDLDWKYLDNLPEIHFNYSDAAWTNANKTTSTNPTKLRTPTSLYSSDYGYNTGVLIYRGHFVATGLETILTVTTQGGSAYGSSAWIGSTYLGSWPGIDATDHHTDNYTLPNLKAGRSYTITVLVDNNGLDESYAVGADQMKRPRGILDYTLLGRAKADITWKLTGNLGGETYIDKVRGPLNEGGLYAERQGFTQPSPPSEKWASGSPLDGISSAGVAFYQTEFVLDLPSGYDIPLSFVFANTTFEDGNVSNFRAQLWVNGYQFGKYVNNIGPQTVFPVPQGILDYHGKNWLAVELWAQQASGAQLGDFTLEAGTVAWTAMQEPAMAPIPSYTKRGGAY